MAVVSGLELPEQGLPSALADKSEKSPAVEVAPDHVAYLAFTSGSTGEPKGIVGVHRPISHFLTWYAQRFELGESDRFSMLSGLSHDPLLRDVFTPLWVGGTLCVPPEDRILEPDALASWLNAQKITVAHMTPAMGQLLLEGNVSRTQPLPSLRLMTFGGDVLATPLVTRLRERASTATVVNVYGATETPQAMAYHVVEVGGEEGCAQPTAVPLGRGIDGVQLLVMTPEQRLAAIGELGEIIVRTPYLTRGYLEDSALTAARFTRNPLSEGDDDRVYRTGDFGRYEPNGSVAFVSRRDDQVKIRGFRVELGDVEAALSRHPNVSACVVRADEAGEGRRRLVAYVVPERKADELGIGGLRDFLRVRLPAYMIPALFVPLDELPLTPNGKVDRSRLPVPTAGDGVGHSDSSEPAVPKTPLEVQLSVIWEQVLGVPDIGATDNFFELGGHSLLAVRMFSQLSKVFGRDLPLTTLFQAPTVKALAAVLNEKGWSPRWKSLVAIQPGGTKAPLFLVPGLWGDVFLLAPLAHLLGSDQPLYGFQSRGIDGSEKPLTVIEDMARVYLADLRQFQPEGPYLLGGACMGGAVAFEMAQQLVAAGERVDLLALIEPSRRPVDDLGAPPRKRSLGAAWRTQIHSVLQPVVFFWTGVIRHLREIKQLEMNERYFYIREKLGIVREMILHRDVYRGDRGILYQEIVVKANYEAMMAYKPKSYAGRLHIIIASNRPIDSVHDARLNWNLLAEGGSSVESMSVEDSGRMFIDPHVQDLAQRLGRILNEVAQRPAPGAEHE